MLLKMAVCPDKLHARGLYCNRFSQVPCGGLKVADVSITLGLYAENGQKGNERDKNWA
jgi:hypothetical protein